MGGFPVAPAIRILRRKTAGLFLFGLLALLGGSQALSAWLPLASTAAWTALAALCWTYFTFLLSTNLAENRVPGGEVSGDLGPANLITIVRALLMSAFAGLLLVPRFEGVLAWLPGILYISAALPDYVDGIVARRTGRSTRLGEAMDMHVDSIGVLAAAALAVRYGTVPAWYLPIGLARYLFVAGLRVRERLGLPVYELPPSIRRRGFAALIMGFMFAVLFPVFHPPATHLAALALGPPVAAGFLWDWGLATGRIRPGTAGPGSPGVRALLGWPPVLLRLAAVLLGASVIGGHLLVPEIRAIAVLEVGAIALVGLGAAARGAAILAAVLLGLAQNAVPLGGAGTALVFVYTGLVILGGGRFSLLAVEDRLIRRRIGETV